MPSNHSVPRWRSTRPRTRLADFIAPDDDEDEVGPPRPVAATFIADLRSLDHLTDRDRIMRQCRADLDPASPGLTPEVWREFGLYALKYLPRLLKGHETAVVGMVTRKAGPTDYQLLMTITLFDRWQHQDVELKSGSPNVYLNKYGRRWPPTDD